MRLTNDPVGYSYGYDERGVQSALLGVGFWAKFENVDETISEE